MKSFIYCVLVLFIFGTSARADCTATPIRGLVADTIRVAGGAITATADIIDVARIGVRKSARAITMRGAHVVRTFGIRGVRSLRAVRVVGIRPMRAVRAIGIRSVRIVGYLACG